MSVSKQVTLIDYGAGNLLNVQRAFEHLAVDVKIATTAEEVFKAERIVFPGVGAFPEAMQQLQSQELVEAIKESALEKPFLGICLGMQMMLDSSDEFGLTNGLGLIPGQVKKLPGFSTDNVKMTIPHMGWSKIRASLTDWQNSPFSDIPEENAFYFVHSFYADVKNAKDQLAVFDFGGHAITAAIQKDNLIGCQFHPEKSGELGLKIIQSYLQI